jgi:predicted transcriptional regulator of viral defense system
MKNTIMEKVLKLAWASGAITSKDLEKRGIGRQHLYYLHKRGLLERVARGLYIPKNLEVAEYETVAEVFRRVPRGVICLLSALEFHELGTQLPQQIWLAIGPGKRRPNEPRLPIRVVHFSEETFRAGIEEHDIGGVRVKVYSPAKTVADCFKFRNKIGLDVALEALRECLRQRKCTHDELYRYATICRVWKVMRPYLEALT